METGYCLDAAHIKASKKGDNMKSFKVINQMVIEDCSVLTLDNKRTIEEFDTTLIICENASYSYAPTHNPYIINVDSTDDFLGKTIQFVV